MSGILSAADLPACRCGELATLDQCYFEPLSSCTWRDALQDTEEPRCIKSPTMVMLADLSAHHTCPEEDQHPAHKHIGALIPHDN